MLYEFCSKFHTLSSKHFENPLRFDKVTESSKVGTFLSNSYDSRTVVFIQWIRVLRATENDLLSADSSATTPPLKTANVSSDAETLSTAAKTAGERPTATKGTTILIATHIVAERHCGSPQKPTHNIKICNTNIIKWPSCRLQQNVVAVSH